MTTTDSLLIFHVGPVPCCVDSNNVQIVIEPPAHITAIPGSNSFRPGLIVHTKRTVSVYDVRTKFNLSTGQRGKIIITELANRLLGFWVDSIQSVILSSEGKSQILPAECPKELFESLFILDDQLIFKTNFDALAKAQVNTQTQHFINKLMSEKEKNIKAAPSSSKTTAIKSKAEQNITNQRAKFATPLTNSTSTPTTSPKINAVDSSKRTLAKDFKNETKAVNKPTVKPIPSNRPTNQSATNVSAPFIKSSELKAGQPVKNQSPKSKPLSGSQKSTYTNQLKNKNLSSSDHAPNESKTNSLPKSNKTIEASSATHTKKTEQSKQSFAFTTISLLFLITIIAATTWWLLFDSSDVNKKPNREISQTIIPIETAYEQIPEINYDETDPVSIIDNTYKEVNLPEAETGTAIENTLAKDEKDNFSDISIDDKTIIITLNDSEGKFNEKDSATKLPTETSATQLAAVENIADNTIKLEGEKPLLNISIIPKGSQLTDNNKDNNTPENISKKIVHIIVKGDTLWHIAKRYINNPYKYPQLAKLSKIKNPDLIYPGNRVIIVIKKSGTKQP